MNREKIAPDLVVEKDALIGEGAVWDADDELLYWVDILGHEVYVYDPVSGINRTIPTCQAVGTVVKRQSGGLVVALHNGFAHIDLRTERMVPLGEDPERDLPGNRFNDGKCDPAGRLWAGTMEFGGARDQGALYCLDVDHSVSRKVAPVSISNGIVWSADQQTMYFIDSGLNNVRAYDYCRDSGGHQQRARGGRVRRAGGVRRHGHRRGRRLVDRRVRRVVRSVLRPPLWGVAAPLGTADVQCDILRLWRRGPRPALHHFGLPGFG